MRQACGIDFGTTNSTIGVLVNNQPQMTTFNNKSYIPTALFFETDNRDPFFGQKAIDHYISGESGRLVRSIKRILGTDLIGKYTLINDKWYKYDRFVQMFLTYLKQATEQTLQETIDCVVMGRPVHFQDDNETADKQAQKTLETLATLAGFKHIAFQYEPIAAAFAHEQHLDAEKLALVVDIGGGTTDFTIIRIGGNNRLKRDRKSDILATCGVRIGGNDFDRALSLDAVMPLFGKGSTYGDKNLSCPAHLYADLAEWSKINFSYTAATKDLVKSIWRQANEPEKIERLLSLIDFEDAHRLLKTVEDMKIALSQNPNTASVFDLFSGTIHFNATQESFEQDIANDIDKINKCLLQCIHNAGISKKAIELVILTGGSSQIPLFYKTIRDQFSDAVISQENQMLSVGYGLVHATKYME